MNQRLTLPKIRWREFIAIAIITCYFCMAIAPTPLVAQSPDWIIRSDEYADLLRKAIAAKECQPQSGTNESLLELDPAFKVCRRKSIFKVVGNLAKQRSKVNRADLRLDLSILLEIGEQELRSYALQEKYRVPYINLSQAILDSFKSTQKSKSPTKRQAAILIKLRQYAGLEPGAIALTKKLERAIDTQLQKPEIALPNKEQIKDDLKNSASQVYAIQDFLRQQQVPDYEEAYAQLKIQLFDYEKFIRRKVLTKAEGEFRLPRELYVLELQKQGIDIPVAELVTQAHTAFVEVQQRMKAIARPKLLAKKDLGHLITEM